MTVIHINFWTLNHVYDVVAFFSQVIFIFPLFQLH